MKDQTYLDSESKMDKSIHAMSVEFDGIRAGRANTAILDRVTIDYYGTPTPIAQVATVATADARTITIQPWEARLLKEIEKAIQISDIGINPNNDGRVIRLVFPPLTEERRKDLSKQVSAMGEKGKIAIRNIRRTAMDDYKEQKKNAEITEDDQKKAEKAMQSLTDAKIKEIDELVAKKQAEIMSI